MAGEDDHEVPEGTPQYSEKEAAESASLVKSLIGSKDVDLFKFQVPVGMHEGDSALERGMAISEPEYFVKIPDGATAEERMVNVVAFAISSYGTYLRALKKPFNSLTFEQFIGHWTSGEHRIDVVNEQVSHHPPGSAFHYECESRKIKMFGTMIAGKPKFTGIAVRAPLEGDRQLVLEEFGETYTFHSPAVVIRGILIGRPFIDFNGTMTIECEATKMSVSVEFKEKPWLRGEYGRLSGTIKQGGKDIFKVSGNLRRTVEVTDLRREKDADATRTIFTRDMTKHTPPTVAPIEEQHSLESQRVWSEVRKGLKEHNNKAASEAKHQIEEKQRVYYKEVESGKRIFEPVCFAHDETKTTFRIRPDWKTRVKEPMWIDIITLPAH